MDPNQPNSANPEQLNEQPPPQPAPTPQPTAPVQEPTAHQPIVNPGAPTPVQGPFGAPPAYQQPVAAQQGIPAQQPISDPGKGLAIASLILWFFGLAPIGLICAIISRSKTYKAGLPSATLATVGIVLNAITSIILFLIVPMLVITTYSGIQMKARDSKRKSDIVSIQTQLEVFFSTKAYYPSLEDLNDPTWRSTNMSSLDPTALSDPSGSSTVLVATPTAKKYSYEPTDKNGGACTGAQAKCEHYTLTVKLESSTDGQTTYQKTDLN